MSSESEKSDRPTKAHPCNADAFVEEFAKHTREMDNKRFCFLLGAGASKSSGISLGGELAKEWLQELHSQEAPSGQSLEEWATGENLGIPGFSLSRAADFYTRIFERRFEGRMDDGQFWLEKKFGTALPSTGYYFLAQILGGSKHKVVITTNFDNLAADAVLQLTGNLPRIISDARIARFLSPQPRLPIIAKVHGDIGFATINTTDGIAKLDKEWKEPLRRILELYVPIVIGWEGNDGSLMDFFTEEMVDEQKQSLLPAGIFWCYRSDKSWQDRLAQNSKLAALTRVHTVRFIQIVGFDEWMLRLARSLSQDNPLDKLQDQQKRRMDVFEGKLREELKQTEKAAAANPNLTPKRKEDLISVSVMLLVHDAMQEKDIHKRIEKLRRLTQSHPENAPAHGALARELHKSKSAPDEAESHYQKAIASDPNHGNNLGSYAVFLLEQRKDADRAEEYFQKALAADPNNAINLGNYAIFLQTQRKDADRAEEYFQMALAADPNNATNLGGYALFLQTERKDVDRAEEYFQNALAADPNHATTLGSYALFLQTERENDARAEEYFQKSLSADPNNATALTNYSEFLLLHRTMSDAAVHLAQVARSESMKNPAQTHVAAAILWMSAVVAEKEGQPRGAILGALKSVVLSPGYTSTFGYGNLVAWVGTNVQPPEVASFWIAVARVCGGTEKLESLDQFPRWRDTKPVPLEEGLRAVASIS